MYHLSEYYHGGYCADAGPEKASGGGGGGVGGDHFIVEDIFDFSNGDDGDGNGGGGGEEDDGVFDAVTGNLAESAVVAAGGGNYCSSSFGGPHFSDNLCEPYEESAELEWLSNFVEDCFSTKLDIQKLHPTSQTKPTSSETTQDSSQSARPPVTAKARSKRSRGGPGSWASRLPPVLSSSPSASASPPSSSTTTTTTSEKPPRRYASATDGHKCLHCGSDKTPQWRTGPMGPKTLCNACGVRYKSGRLVPEYRPAASPTFVVSEHSNSHRKVVELRRQKEMQMQQHQQVLYWS